MDETTLKKLPWQKIRKTLIAVLILVLVINPLLTYAPFAIGNEGDGASQEAEVQIAFESGNANISVDGAAPTDGVAKAQAGEDFEFSAAASDGFSLVEVTATAPGGTAVPVYAVEDGIYKVDAADVVEGIIVRVSTVEIPAAAEPEGDGQPFDTEDGLVEDEPQAEEPTEEGVETEEGAEAEEEDAEADVDAAGLLGIQLFEGSEIDANSGAPLKAATPKGLFVTADGGATITGYLYNGADAVTDVEIPEEIVSGVKVTKIGNNAFEGCQLTSVVIPQTVTTLGNSAFLNNPLMTAVVFSGTSQLTSIGSSAFKDCKKFDGFVIPEGVKTVGDNAFQNCDALSAIVIPNTVTQLGAGAFMGCTSLASVSLSTGLSAIASWAFQKCSALKSIIIPDSVISIERSAFEYSGLQSVALPSNLKTIAMSAFANTQLAEIHIPISVESIDAGAFTGVSTKGDFRIYLTEHDPDKVPGKPWGAATDRVYWKSDDSSCFYIRADGVIVGLKPDDHACSNPSNHLPGAELVIPEKVGEVRVTGFVDYVFANNKNLKTVKFADNVSMKSIAPAAFFACSNLMGVYNLPQDLETIGDNAFGWCAIQEIAFPASLKTIGAAAFDGNTTLKKLTFNQGLETIGNNAFQRCSGLGTVEIPSSVEQIGASAFAGCGGLTTVVIKGIDSDPLTIGKDAFPTTSNIKDIFLSDRTYDTVSGQPWGAQYAAVHWFGQNYDPEVINVEGWEFNRIQKKIIAYYGKTGAEISVTIPYELAYNGTTYTVDESKMPAGLLTDKTFKTVTLAYGYKAASWSMCDRTKCKEIILPDSLVLIGGNAFKGNTVLEKINIPASVTTIDRSAFEGCTSLNEITGFLPSGLVSMEYNVFANVPLKIENLTLPEGLKTIGTETFKNCQLSGQVTIPNSVTSIANNVFNGNPDITSFYVDQYRSESPIAKAAPFTTDRTVSVFYKGERPNCSHVETANPALTDTPLTQVDFKTYLDLDGKGAPVTNLAGVWLSKSDVFDTAEAIRLFDSESSGGTTEFESSFALPEGTYYVYVSTVMMTKDGAPDPSQYARHRIDVSKPASLELDANSVSFVKAKIDVMNDTELRAALLGRSAAYGEDAWSKNEADSYIVSDDDLALVRALKDVGDSVDIVINAEYLSGSFDYAATEGNLVYFEEDNPFVWTSSNTKTITVTLANGYTVSFSKGTHGVLDGDPADVVTHEALQIGSPMPEAPGVTADEGWKFIGWKDSDEGEVLTTLPDTVTDDVTYTAQYDPIPYTLTFNLNLGESAAIPAQTPLYKGDLAKKPADPSRMGYDFSGWTYNGAAWDFGTSTMPAADVELVAQWTAIPYTVTFHANDSSGLIKVEAASMPGSQTKTIGQKVDTVNNPVRTGYDFDGWYKENTCANKWDFVVNTVGAANLDLYAKWNPITYTITYDLANGAMPENVTNPSTYTAETPKFSLKNPERAGYTFTGWTGTELSSATDPVEILQGSTGNRSYTATWAPSDGTSYTVQHWLQDTDENYPESLMVSDDSLTGVTEDIATATAGSFAYHTLDLTVPDTVASGEIVGDGSLVLKLYYTLHEFAIDYRSDGADAATNTAPADDRSYFIGTEATASGQGDLARVGYTFAGWALASDAAEPDYQAGDMIDPVEDGITLPAPAEEAPQYIIALYPVWTAIDYTLSFDLKDGTAPDGTDAIENQTLHYQDLASNPGAPTKEGHTFAGWAYEKTTWDFNLSTMPASNVELVAQWTAIPYTVTFHANDADSDIKATNVPAPQTKTIGQAVDGVFDPVRTGYTFGGWYTESACENAWNFATGTVGASNLDLYAKWTPKTYVLTYKFNDNATADDASHSYTVPNTTVNDVITASRTHYTFAGWYTADGANGKWGSKFENGAVLTGDTTVWAKWVADSFPITYKLDGGAMKKGESNPGTYTVEDSFTLKNPERAGYDFAGWTGTGLGGKTDSVTIAAGSSGPREYTANWVPRGDTGYTVEHYKQRTDETYPEQPDDTDLMENGTTDQVIEAVAKGYPYHTVDLGVPGTVASGTVTVDGKLVLKLYYPLQKFAIAYQADGATSGEAPKDGTNYFIGTQAEAAGAGTLGRTGYDFVGWALTPGAAAAAYAPGAAIDPVADKIALGTAGTNAPHYTVQLFPVWMPATYAITYELDGGTVAAGNPDSYTIETATFSLNAPVREGWTFLGWTGSNGDAPQKAVTVENGSTGDLDFLANWKQDNTGLQIDARNFRMSLAEAQAHKNMEDPDGRFKDLIARGRAHAWWQESGDAVDITYLVVAPTNGKGQAIEVAVGTYNVTYFALAEGLQVQKTVLCTIYGNVSPKGGIAGNDFTYNIAGGQLTETAVRNRGGVTVYDPDGKPTSELGRINRADLETLNAAIRAGQLGPVKVRFTNAAGDEVTITVMLVAAPPAPAGPTPASYTPGAPLPAPTNPVEAALIPAAEVLRDIAVTVIPASETPTTQISGEGTPLAESHAWCWVHYYIGLFMLVTLAYGAAVIIRRRKFTGDMDLLEDRVLGRRERLAAHPVRPMEG